MRGLNLPINAKLPDFMPLKNKTALEALPLYGTSIARLLFSWEAFEPERGQYSMEYLDYYLGLVEVSASLMQRISLEKCAKGVNVQAAFQEEDKTPSPSQLQGCTEDTPHVNLCGTGS